MPQITDLQVHAVLVQRDQCAERRRASARRAAARWTAGCPDRPSADRRWRCAVGQRLGLREQVGEQRTWLSGADAPGAATPMKSAGTVSVPWCRAWKKLCWLSVPAPPHITGTVRIGDRRAVVAHRLAEALHHQLLQVAPAATRGARRTGSTACVARPSALRFQIAVSACQTREVGSQRRRQRRARPSPPRRRAAAGSRRSRSPARSAKPTADHSE